MRLRDRAFFATSALLYSGPLYAGAAGYGLDTVPLFAVLFMIWLNVARPGDWPRDREEWRIPRAWAWPMLIFVVQMAVVAFCIVVGGAIAGFAGLTLPLPLLFTLLVSALGISLAKLLQREGGGMGAARLPGEELGIGAGILDVARPEMPTGPSEAEFVEAVLIRLADLPPEAHSAEGMAPILDEVVASGIAPQVLNALEAVAGKRPAMAQAAALLALRPEVSRELIGQGRIRPAVNRALASGRPLFLLDTAQAALEALRALPELARELPPATRLRGAAEGAMDTSPGASAALAELADTLDPKPRR